MMKLECPEVREWLRRDLDGAADPSSEVAEHIERCKGCTREAERIRALASAARECLPRAAVPFDFTDRVMDAVTEPVGDDALADAVRPRRSLALAVVALMVGLTVLVFWPRGEQTGSGDRSGSMAEGGAAAEAGMVFVLTEHGELIHQGKSHSLDGVIELLRKKKPQSILLRASAKAPWQQVQWFLIACAEAGIWKTRLAVGRGPARDAFLPRDRGIRPGGPARPLKIQISAVGLREVREQRGPANFRRVVGVPAVVVYSEPGRSAGTRSLDDVARWVAEAKRAAQRPDREVFGEIKAAHKVPFGAVFGILRSFQQAGFEDVRFYGTSPLTRELRRRSCLPYPENNWGGEPVRPDPAAPDRVVEEAIEEAPEEEAPEEIVEEEVREEPIDPLSGIRERVAVLAAEIEKGGDGERITRLRAELAVARKRFKELLRVELLRRENARLRARMALLEARAKAEVESSAVDRARAALAEALARKNAPPAPRVPDRLRDLGTERDDAARRAYVAALAALYAADIERIEARIRKAGPNDELLAQIEALRLQIAQLTGAGLASGNPPGTGPGGRRPRPPLTSRQLIELFTARAKRIHGEFQAAWAAKETEAANAAKRRLDRTRALLNRAAAVQEMQAEREERKRKGQPTAALETKIARELAALRRLASPARAARAGVVKRVRGRLLSISLGSNDGVRVGEVYEVRRGAVHVGRLLITKVDKDQAVGEFDPKSKGPGAPPMAGDVAEARKDR